MPDRPRPSGPDGTSPYTPRMPSRLPHLLAGAAAVLLLAVFLSRRRRPSPATTPWQPLED